MKAVAAAAILLVSSTHALVARTSTCCFSLTAAGGPGGVVGQLSDGQNRIGQGLPPATYCIDNGAITDGSGRGCILTPPTTQFQCDTGATPQGGFAVGCNGTLTYDGSNTFYACPTGDDGGYNIYTTPPAGQAGCSTILLNANGCSTCPSTSSTPTWTPTPSSSPCPTSTPTTTWTPTITSSTSPCPTTTLTTTWTSTSTSTPTPIPSTCPTNLSGSYQFPHLIIPIDSTQPETALGTSYDGEISSTVSSIFDFDIPSSYAGELCSLIFLFPEQSQLQTSSYNFTGPGTIDFSMLSAAATTATDYTNAPSVATDYGVFTVAPGNSYSIATFKCPAGERIAFELKSVGGTDLWYFQDYNPSPIGLYITNCN